MDPTKTDLFKTTDDQLRTFWRTALLYVNFLVIKILVTIAIGLPLSLTHVPTRVGQAIIAPSLAAAILGFMVCLRRFVDRGPWRETNLLFAPRAIPQFALKFMVAGIAISAVTAIYVAVGWVRPHPYQLTASMIVDKAFSL